MHSAGVGSARFPVSASAMPSAIDGALAIELPAHEAEVFADAGFDDLFVAYPAVGEDKGRRLLALADRVRLAVECVERKR